VELQPILANPRFSERLVFDVALTLEGSGDDLQDILKRHTLSVQDFADLQYDNLFLQRLGEVRTEIKEKGLTFKMKARSQAEELLTTSWVLIHSPDVSAAVKADLIKSTVKWAGLEPKGDQVEAGGTGGVRILINMGGSQPQTINAPVVEVSRAEVLGAQGEA
jgi:hypothetical protein